MEILRTVRLYGNEEIDSEYCGYVNLLTAVIIHAQRDIGKIDMLGPMATPRQRHERSQAAEFIETWRQWFSE